MGVRSCAFGMRYQLKCQQGQWPLGVKYYYYIVTHYVARFTQSHITANFVGWVSYHVWIVGLN